MNTTKLSLSDLLASLRPQPRERALTPANLRQPHRDLAVVPQPAHVEHDTSGIRRRERRAMRDVQTYGASCPCGARAWEYGIGSSVERDQARQDWDLAHQDCA